jgi:hypothetical protein
MRAPVCRFGASHVAAQVASSNTLKCVVPRMMYGVTTLDVVDAGNTEAELTVSATGNFAVFQRLSPSTITPASASQDGGSVVNIITKVNMPKDVQCRFGGRVTVSALRLAPAELRCITPAHHKGNVTVEIMAGTYDNVFSSTRFEYHTRLNVTSFLPNSGPVAGGTKVLISGSHYLTRPLGSPVCFFGAQRVVAKQITPSRLECASPSHAAGFAAVRIANEPGDYDFAASDRKIQFEFQEAATVSDVFPRSAPIVGESVVTIIGNNFIEKHAHCVFGPNAPTRATFVSSTELRCKAAPTSAGVVSIAVSNNFIGQYFDQNDFTTNRVDFAYLGNVPEVTAVKPQYGPATGGTSITLGGFNYFSYDSGLFCKFGATIFVRAMASSRYNVTCAVPAGVIGNTTVELTNNYQTYSTSVRTFEYQGPVNVTAIAPFRGVTSGRGMVVLSADGLSSRSASALNLDLPTDIWCRFSKTTTEALFDKDGINTIKYGLFERAVTPTSVRCRTSPHSAGWVSVEVSMNQVDFSSSGLQYEFSEVPTVTGVMPTGGSARGGTLVTVSGSGFREEGEVLCRFGASFPVKAVVQSSTELLCRSPHNPVGAADVTVTNLGAEPTGYSAPHVRFTYLTDAMAMTLIEKVGITEGGSKLMIAGARFEGIAQGHFCVLEGRLRIAATMQNGTHLACITPAHKTGNVTVAFSTNGLDIQASPLQFEYVANSNLTSVMPSRMPLTGGSKLSLIGTGFVPRTNAATYCRFDLDYAPATIISSTRIACMAPSQAAGFKAIEVNFSPDKYSVTTGSRAIVEAATARTVTAVQPTHGWASGGTVVSVFGSNFQGEGLYVRFGSMPLVKAEIVSSTQLRVVAPSAVLAPTLSA